MKNITVVQKTALQGYSVLYEDERKLVAQCEGGLSFLKFMNDEALNEVN